MVRLSLVLTLASAAAYPSHDAAFTLQEIAEDVADLDAERVITADPIFINDIVDKVLELQGAQYYVELAKTVYSWIPDVEVAGYSKSKIEAQCTRRRRAFAGR